MPPPKHLLGSACEWRLEVSFWLVRPFLGVRKLLEPECSSLSIGMMPFQINEKVEPPLASRKNIKRNKENVFPR